MRAFQSTLHHAHYSAPVGLIFLLTLALPIPFPSEMDYLINVSDVGDFTMIQYPNLCQAGTAFENSQTLTMASIR